MRELRNPARPLYQNTLNLDKTIISEEDSGEEDYHTYFHDILVMSEVAKVGPM